jgi:hypothetical protein
MSLIGRKTEAHGLGTCQRFPNERELLLKEALHQRGSVARLGGAQLGSAEVRDDTKGVRRGVDESSRYYERRSSASVFIELRAKKVDLDHRERVSGRYARWPFPEARALAAGE